MKRPPAKYADGLPVCDRCGLLIYPPESAGGSLGLGCQCKKPKPQPGLLPGGPDAVQLGLPFDNKPHRTNGHHVHAPRG